MTTEEARSSISYGSIVSNLLALRDEVRETNHGEAEAIERIVTDFTALRMRDVYIAEMSIANRRS